MSSLNQIFDEYWETQLAENPFTATYLGDRRYEHLVPDLSEETHAAQIEASRRTLEKVRAVPEAGLSEADRLNRAVFERSVGSMLARDPFQGHFIALSQMGGVHLDLLQISALHPMSDKAGLESFIERIRSFGGMVDQVRHLLTRGVETGMVGARVNLEPVLAQIRGLVATPIDENVLLIPYRNPAAVDAATGARLLAQARRLVEEVVQPAYAGLADFLERDYLPHCREEVGLHALPNGRDYYAQMVAHHTSSDLSPEAIHQIGHDEVARIHGEMRSVMKSVGFDGNLRDFSDSLRNNPDFFFETEEELLEGFRAILRAVDHRLPELFGRLPKLPYEVRPVEAYKAKNAPDAYYIPPPADGSRPGIYYANTYDPSSRPKYMMEALSYHEAVPGHHLQLAIVQDLEGIPAFRKYAFFTAYLEGWALYSERLPKEIGFYQDPYSEFGRLTLEVWRAGRLVVDTGLHHLGWSREDGIAYFSENSALTQHNVVAEVERYISMAGQALAYKIGELKISALRTRAESALGADFDLRGFHDRLLERGALPLDLLEASVQDWIESRRK